MDNLTLRTSRLTECSPRLDHDGAPRAYRMMTAQATLQEFTTGYYYSSRTGGPDRTMHELATVATECRAVRAHVLLLESGGAAVDNLYAEAGQLLRTPVQSVLRKGPAAAPLPPATVS